MGEKTTLVVTAVPNPTEMPSVQAYLKGVMPLFVQAGGQLVRRLKTTQVLDGRPAGVVSLAETRIGEGSPVRLRHVAEIDIQLILDCLYDLRSSLNVASGP